MMPRRLVLIFLAFVLQARLGMAQGAERSAATTRATTRPTTGASRPAALRAARVAIIVDATGSMMSLFEREVQVVGKIVEGLDARQQFTVTVLRDEQTRQILPAPVPATDANKRRVAELLGQITPHGAGGPEQAITAAIGTRPDVVYFLSDGDFPDNQAVLRTFRERNPNGAVRVHTVSLHARNDPEEYWKVMREIAVQNEGEAYFAEDFVSRGK